MDTIHIALVGNPNSGKTTLFNALTGSRQRVGNWPGVTVERVVGEFEHRGATVEVTDLPGIYSFSAFTADEEIARTHILMARPDVVVNIVDATNLERHLYLTTQLLEMKARVVLALNMVDMANRRGIRIETEHLARHLGCPVISMVASRGQGIEALRDAIHRVAREGTPSDVRVQYDSEMEKAIAQVQDRVQTAASEGRVDARWLALKLLEKDELALRMAGREDVLLAVNQEAERVKRHTGEDADLVIADGRYGFVHGLSRDVILRDGAARRTRSDRLDKVVLNRYLGVPIFLAVMFVVFSLTIRVGEPFIHFFERLCGALLVDGPRAALESWGVSRGVAVFLADGVGGGLQVVSTFIPPIFLVFLCLAVLEDSGYMARAAFVMDRSMRRIGLPGKAFISMLVGFGCNVPGILATRTLEDRRDRLLAIFVNPFMSCGARLPVYTLFAAAFFPGTGGPLLFGLYLTGIALAVLTGLVFKRTILRGEVSTFVMELPPYHLPTVRGVIFHAWTRLNAFLWRAGRVIVAVVVLMTLLNSVGADGRLDNQDPTRSVLSAVGRAITPAFRPMGVTDENWPATVGLFMGIFSKESVIGVLDSLYTQLDAPRGGEGCPTAGCAFNLWKALRDAFDAIPEGFGDLWRSLIAPFGGKPQDHARPASIAHDEPLLRSLTRHFPSRTAAVAYLLFVLIYTPCAATIVAIGREANWRWAAFSVCYQTLLAWVVSTSFYQVCVWPERPASSALWLVFCCAACTCVVLGLKAVARRLPEGS